MEMNVCSFSTMLGELTPKLEPETNAGTDEITGAGLHIHIYLAALVHA
jgi:hypothetical protein